jgi:methylmalonyl-CoA mutase
MKNQGHSSPNPELLLEDFSTPDLGQWRQEVERLLKGAPFAKKMFTKTLEGITIEPMYTAVDTEELPWKMNYPGQWPYLRGTQPAKKSSAPWLVAQELLLPTAEDFNHAIGSDLKRGQTAINLVLDKAGLLGLDPDQAADGMVGAKGTSIAAVADLGVAFDGVDLENVPLFVQAGSAALPVAALLLALMENQGTDPSRLSGCLGSDPAFGLAQLGQLPLALDRLYDELAVISHWAIANAPNLKTLPVHEDPWHDGGADSALSLGLVLASAVQKLRAMETRGLELDDAAAQIQFQLCMGTDFFMEIAKVRALRLLWSDVLSAAGCPTVAAAARVHARTSRRTLTLLDPHVNMLRVTTQAMSAVFGGVDSLHVSPFDEMDSVPDEFSRRIARNVQLILAHECRFDQVQDPAGGSWYVEKLTADLAHKAWAVFQDVEARGGIIEGMKSGWVQEQVAAAAKLRQDRLATRRDVLVGTNQYPNPQEPGRRARTVDHTQLKALRSEAMTRLRASGRHEEHMVVLGRLEKIMDAGSAELLPLLTDAAASGATLGELTGILRHDTDADPAVKTITLKRDAEPFENLRREVAELGANNRVFAACLADVAGYMPRLDFTRGFFQAGGFEVLESGHFNSADDAAKAAADSGASVVVLVGLDTTYTGMASEAGKKLKALSPPPRVILAGGGPELPSDIDFSINARSNVLEVLGQLAGDLKVQS